MFKRKEKIVKTIIDHEVQVHFAEAMHIKRTGSYVLQFNTMIPNSIAKDVVSDLKKKTGANWVIIQGGGNVVRVD